MAGPQQQQASQQRPPQTQQTTAPQQQQETTIASAAVAYLALAEDKLLKAGWTPAGFNGNQQKIWQSPPPKESPKFVTLETKTRDGKTETYKQHCGAPIPWTYDTDSAILILRQQEAATK